MNALRRGSRLICAARLDCPPDFVGRDLREVLNRILSVQSL